MLKEVRMEVGAAARRRRRRRLLTRALPLAALAAFGFAVGVIIASGMGDGGERDVVVRYVRAWARGDWARMYSLLDAQSQQRTTEAQFVAAYASAANTATLDAIAPVKVDRLRRGVVAVRLRLHTRLFGTLVQTLAVPVSGQGSATRIPFSSALLFPGLAAGESLVRRVQLAPRAALFASDGTPLAKGHDRSSPIPDVASEIAGVLGPIPAAQAQTYAAAGYPPDAKVGLDGLERIFERTLAGTPGGVLLAGTLVIARRPAIPGHDVRTTIVPAIERAVIAAKAGRYAGIVVMDPRTGALLAVAGVAFSVLQPPGSTMKIVTVTGALEARLVKLTDTFPIATSATIEGYSLQNANGEACGGSLVEAFAVSCNSVFAPIGARLGARRLVGVAQRFGFNEAPPIPGVAESQIPSASTIGDALAVGSSAIGQGRVQATALEMTDVAATIAMGGRRPVPTLLAQQPPRFLPVTSAGVAALVTRMMVAVVRVGTGTAAAIPGVEVAGKTGTAELRNTAVPTQQGSTTPQPPPPSPKDTDAWFVGFAPVQAPRVVVGALFPGQGAGGDTAAPAAHDILVAALQAVPR